MEASKANIARIASSVPTPPPGADPRGRPVNPAHRPGRDGRSGVALDSTAPVLLSIWRWRHRLTAAAAVMALDVDDGTIGDLAGRLTDAGV